MNCNIVYKKGNEMQADFLSRYIWWKLSFSDEDFAENRKTKQWCSLTNKKEPIQQIHKKKFFKPAEKLAFASFIENELLWTRFTLTWRDENSPSDTCDTMETCSMVMRANSK